MALADQIAGALHDGQGGQTQEIHLEQAQFVDDLHLELGDRLDGRIFRAAGGAVQGQVFHHGTSVMTTPAACVPALRTTPSIWLAVSIRSCT